MKSLPCVLPCLALSLFACGGGGDSSTDGGSLPDAPPGEPGPDAGEGEGSPDGGGDLVPLLNGRVAVSSDSYDYEGTLVESHYMYAYFANQELSGCTNSTAGDCVISACLAGTVGEPPYPEAGMLMASGGTTPLELTPDEDGSYTGAGGVGKLFSGGETLTFSAAGGAEVPAFTGEVTAPTGITITGPTLPAAPNPLVITRGEDLEFTWTDEPNGEVVVDTSIALLFVNHTLTETGDYVSIICSFPIADGSGTLPGDATADLPDGEHTGSFYLAVRSQTTIMAGDYEVALVGETTSHTEEGGAGSSTVTFE